MLRILFAILLVAWLLGVTAFHVASGFINLLLLLAIISLVMHFVRGQRVA
ncbi:MAG: lmo0937 family membrane protein [Bryobacteraceae bacterium]